MIIIKFITTENEETELKYTLKKEKKEKRLTPYQQNHHYVKKFWLNTKHTHTHNQSIQKNLTLYPFNLATQQRKNNDRKKI